MNTHGKKKENFDNLFFYARVQGDLYFGSATHLSKYGFKFKCNFELLILFLKYKIY